MMSLFSSETLLTICRKMTVHRRALWNLSVLLILAIHECSGTQNVSRSSSLKDTDVVTAIDQFQAGNLMKNKTRPQHHNYTGVNIFAAPSMVHGFKPVYETDAQFVSITTEVPPPPPPPKRKPGFGLFKKKKKKPIPAIQSPPLPKPTPSQIQPQSQKLQSSEASSESHQRLPVYPQFPPHHHYHAYQPMPQKSAFSRLTSMFMRSPPQQQWRPPKPPVPIKNHYTGPLQPRHPLSGAPAGPYPKPGMNPHAAGSVNVPSHLRPVVPLPISAPYKMSRYRISLNHYLKRISNMFSRSPHVPGYRPYPHPQSPAYPNYYPLNTYAPSGQATTLNPAPHARRKKFRVKKPGADRRLDQKYLTGRPRATKEANSGKPDTMEVKLHTGIHTESRSMLEKGLFNTIGPVFVRFKRDTSAGYRMPGIFGMDGGKPFYLDKV